MKDFFKTRTFISICIIGVLLLGMMVLSIADSGRVSIIEDVIGIVVTPIQNFCTTIIQAGGDFAQIFTEHEALMEENEKLKSQIASSSQAIRNAEQYRLENEELKALIGISEQHKDFVFEQALVVASDFSGYSYTLTLNKGSVNGLKNRDLVITPQGVVGYISDIGSTWCKVTTILDSSCEIGALVTRTQDVGVQECDYTLAESGLCKLSYIKNEAVLNVGDSVETSGISGIFPAGILIGRITELKPETHGISQYAVIEPAVDITEVKNVFVIKEFDGSQTAE